MPIAAVNGVRLSYDLAGDGPVPLVLIHGSRVSRHSWDTVVPLLARDFRVLTYDRRGHSESERLATQGSVHEDVADLVALLEHLQMVPAFVVGNSLGGSIALRFAAQHPRLVRGVVAHEPPLFRLLEPDAAFAPMLAEIGQRIGAVVNRIAQGDHHGAAEQFVETVAFGPGAWPQLPTNIQQTWVDNAPTFLDESKDPEWLAINLDQLRMLERPVLLSHGGQSPPTFEPVIRTLAKAMPSAELHLFKDAGHVAHLTHADEYVDTLRGFVQRHTVV